MTTTKAKSTREREIRRRLRTTARAMVRNEDRWISAYFYDVRYLVRTIDRLRGERSIEAETEPLE